MLEILKLEEIIVITQVVMMKSLKSLQEVILIDFLKVNAQLTTNNNQNNLQKRALLSISKYTTRQNLTYLVTVVNMTPK